MLDGGLHLILDLEGCVPARLDSERTIVSLCRDLAHMMGAKVLELGAHKFHPQGVTAFALISDSHVSAHTWPDKGKAFLDVFTCKEWFDGDRLSEHAVATLGAKRGRFIFLLRDSYRSKLLLDRDVSAFTTAFDFGRTIYSVRSPLQHIEITKGPLGVSLFLDGYWQFVETYEYIYHEALVHPVMACAPRIDRIGIAGGGDGLALREVLRYPQVSRATLCEIDPCMLAVAARHPELTRLNRHALSSRKARVMAVDARKMLVPGARLDVAILDFPSISDGAKFGELYTSRFYERVRRALSPHGVMVTQVTDYPVHLTRTTENLRRVFPFVTPVDVGVHHSMFNFVMASPQPLRIRRPLPPGLRFMNRKRLEAILERQTERRRSA